MWKRSLLLSCVLIAAGSCAGIDSSCTDQVQNGQESDVDCGGGCLEQCADGRSCIDDRDCQSARCVQGVCAKKLPDATCKDGLKNGMETDVDCGGACDKCQEGQACGVDGDCGSMLCQASRCVVPAVLTSVAPRLHPTSGGTMMTLVGERFFSPMDLGVLVDGVAASMVKLESSSKITALAPPRTRAGEVDLVLTLAMGKRLTLTKAIQYYLGNLAYGAAATFGTGMSPAGLVAGDWNGDGTFDLAVANYNSGDVRTYFGNGDGTFRTGSSYATDAGAVRIAAGDLNGDGKPDLAVPSFQFDRLSVLFNNGDGTFRLSTKTATGVSPIGVAIADFTGDGKPDVVTTNRDDDTIGVLPNNGSGGFLMRKDTSGGLYPFNLVTDDINKDGKSDVVVSNLDASAKYVTVFIGKGDGSFQAAVNLALPGAATPIAAGDVNGDGKVDLLAGAASMNSVYVLLGKGDGTFEMPKTVDLGFVPRGLCLADLNLDGRQDMVASNGANMSSQVVVFLGQGDGGFVNGRAFTVGQGPEAVLALDADKDGKPDIAVNNRTNGNSVSVLRNTSN